MTCALRRGIVLEALRGDLEGRHSIRVNDQWRLVFIWSGLPTPDPADLFDFFKQNLPYFAIPRYVEIRSSLPLTEATGRVKKSLLREEGVTPGTWDLDELGFTIAKSDRG